MTRKEEYLGETTFNTRTGNPNNKVVGLKEENPQIKFWETVLKTIRPVDSVHDGGSRGARRF